MPGPSIWKNLVLERTILKQDEIKQFGDVYAGVEHINRNGDMGIGLGSGEIVYQAIGR